MSTASARASRLVLLNRSIGERRETRRYQRRAYRRRGPKPSIQPCRDTGDAAPRPNRGHGHCTHQENEMTTLARLATAAVAIGLTTVHLAAAADSSARPATGRTPTVILVHGAFAESSSWDAVAGRLLARHLPVIAAANPLRGLKDDAAFVSAI